MVELPKQELHPESRGSQLVSSMLRMAEREREKQAQHKNVLKRRREIEHMRTVVEAASQVGAMPSRRIPDGGSQTTVPVRSAGIAPYPFAGVEGMARLQEMERQHAELMQRLERERVEAEKAEAQKLAAEEEARRWQLGDPEPWSAEIRAKMLQEMRSSQTG